MEVEGEHNDDDNTGNDNGNRKFCVLFLLFFLLIVSQISLLSQYSLPDRNASFLQHPVRWNTRSYLLLLL
jgi:hypothetical protein